LQVYLTYEVKVEIRTPSGHDILLTLPFTLQNQPGEALTLARAAEEDPEEFMLKVPAYATIDDELPAYDEVWVPPSSPHPSRNTTAIRGEADLCVCDDEDFHVHDVAELWVVE
jgi:hypothetical protein